MSSINTTLQTLKLVSPEASCNTDLTKGPWLFDTGVPCLRSGVLATRCGPGRHPAPGGDPRRIPRGLRCGTYRPHPCRQGGPRRSPGGPGPPLPARRGRGLRRLRGRLLPAGQRGADPRAGRSTSSSAACTSWPRPPTCSPPMSRRSSCPTWPPAARWRTWPTNPPSRSAGNSSWTSTRTKRTPTGKAAVIPVTYMNSSAALKAFVRQARRDRVHLLERRHGA